MRDITYPPIIATMKAAFWGLGQKFEITGTDHVPVSGGALLVFNHVSYVDFIYGGLAAHPRRRVVRFMAKKEIFDHPIAGPVMRSMHHIPVDRGDGIGSFHQAVDYLRRGELVGIFPEATISRALELKEFKSGAVRIAAEAGVPVIPVILWGTQRMLTKDHPRDLGRGRTISITVGAPIATSVEDAPGQTESLHAVMSTMLDEVIARHPAAEQPPGSWWLPARHGGSAPTLEEAKALDSLELRERLRKRTEARRKKAGKSTK